MLRIAVGDTAGRAAVPGAAAGRDRRARRPRGCARTRWPGWGWPGPHRATTDDVAPAGRGGRHVPRAGRRLGAGVRAVRPRPARAARRRPGHRDPAAHRRAGRREPGRTPTTCGPRCWTCSARTRRPTGDLAGAWSRFAGPAGVHAELLDQEGSAYCLDGFAALALASGRRRRWPPSCRARPAHARERGRGRRLARDAAAGRRDGGGGGRHARPGRGGCRPVRAPSGASRTRSTGPAT